MSTGTSKVLTVTPKTSLTTIQSYLKKKGYTVRFTEGTYKITKTLFLYSNVNIIIDSKAKLIRHCTSHIFRSYIDPSVNYNYNALVNVTISGGGTLVGNGKKSTGSIIGIMHGNNITIKNLSFQGTFKSHAFDISGCSNVILENLKFSKRIIDPKKTYKEEIQIDYAMSAGFPYFDAKSPCYNDNHCKNITINKCTFKDANLCIGTHTETTSNKKHTNIVVTNCTAVGVAEYTGTFLNLINTKGATIKGNKISGFSRQIIITSCSQFTTKNGVKKNTPVSTKTACEDIIIEGNTLSNASGTVKASGIYITMAYEDIRHKNIKIKGNTFNLNNSKAKYDIYIGYTDGAEVDKKNVLKLTIGVDEDTTTNIKK